MASREFECLRYGWLVMEMFGLGRACKIIVVVFTCATDVISPSRPWPVTA
jgi:hypothetical protein